MFYSYKPGCRLKTDPQIAGSVCHELEETGGLTPERLLDASKEENAPLHNEFEWDDTVAANNYRLGQAALIIRSIVVHVEKKEPVPVRAFVRASEEKGNYQSINVVLQDASSKEFLLRQAARDLYAFKQKYAVLEELCSVFNEIDAFQLQIKGGVDDG